MCFFTLLERLIGHLMLTCTLGALNIGTRLKTKQHSAVFCTAVYVRDGIFTLAMATVVGECKWSCGMECQSRNFHGAEECLPLIGHLMGSASTLNIL